MLKMKKELGLISNVYMYLNRPIKKQKNWNGKNNLRTMLRKLKD